MPAQVATLVECGDNAAAKLDVEPPGRFVCGADAHVTVRWTIANGSVTVTDEMERAAIARQGHMAMIAEVGRTWKRIPANHHHPQLESEPDD